MKKEWLSQDTTPTASTPSENNDVPQCHRQIQNFFVGSTLLVSYPTYAFESKDLGRVLSMPRVCYTCRLGYMAADTRV